MFDNLRISLKLQVMVVVAIAGIVAVAAVGLWNLRDNVLQDRMSKVRELVLMARQVVDEQHQQALKAGLSEAQAKPNFARFSS
jgi:Tfp pilus assembly protein PilE